MLKPLFAFYLTVAPASASPEGTSAESAPEQPTTVAVEIESSVGANDEAIEGAVGDLVSRVASEQGMETAPDSERALSIFVTWEEGFNVEIQHTRSPSLPPESESFVCEGCGAGELLDAIEERLEQILPALIREEEETAEKLAPPPEPSNTPPPEMDTGPSRRVDGLGLLTTGLIVGGFGTSGTVGMAIGIGVLAADGQEIKPAHYAVLGVSAAAAAIGIPMIIIGKRRVQRDLRAAASAGPNHALFVLKGRF